MNRDEAHELIDELCAQTNPQQQQLDLSAEELARRFQLVELLIGPWLRQQLREAIAPLDDLPDSRETEHRRGLMMLGRSAIALRQIIGEKIADIVAGDTERLQSGTEGLLLRPMASGPGRKPFDAIKEHLIRRYVLRVYVECARGGISIEQWLKDQGQGPTLDQFRKWATERVSSEDRETAKAIGDALRADCPLSTEQAAMWDEIKAHDPTEIWTFLRSR